MFADCCVFYSYVSGVSFDPTGKILASCSYDKTIRLCNAQTGASIGLPLSDHTR